ncbi:hypothetical protein GGQ84_002520 [Desulfitispora alkaliphila]|uniref:stalk domain-containing protein n=1 Tax=Desulfitispora alkaliphila TaxID=622674 RepID=UPI003D2260B0
MKKTQILFTIIIICILLSAHAFASGQWTVKNIKVAFGDIQVFKGSSQVETSVEPFMVDGTTMVPLRDLSEALGFDVHWDGERNIIHIGSAIFQPDIGKTRGSAVHIEDAKVIRNVGPFYQKERTYKLAGRSFNRGVVVHIEPEEVAEVVVDLNQNYATLEGFFGVEDDTMDSSSTYNMTILGDNQILFQSGPVAPSEYPRYIAPDEVDLTYVNRLIIRVETNRGRIGTYTQLMPVLANFKLYQK